MTSGLSRLLLLLPVDDVASCEYAGMVGNLEGGLDLDVARGGEDFGAERACDDRGIGTSSSGGDLHAATFQP